MKRVLIFCTIALIPALGNSEEQKPQEIVAACNVQVGQALSALGQTQQQVIALQAQVAELQKLIDQKNTTKEQNGTSSFSGAAQKRP